MNAALRGRNALELEQWKNFALHLDKGLLELPPAETWGLPLYRGVNLVVDVVSLTPFQFASL